jgi:hypothetical protein
VCTVSVIRLADPPPVEAGSAVWSASTSAGFRLVANRDESVLRPAALPPRRQVFGRRRAILPIDPQGNGTWVAVNDAGLALALLNLNRDPPATRPAAGPSGGPAPGPSGGSAPGLVSRGRIIPGLLHCAAVREASEAAAGVDPRAHAPVRVVMTDGRDLAEAASDGAALRLHRVPLPEGPVLFTSSGLGDEVVEAPRRALFDEIFARSGDPARLQDLFHDHSWPDRPEVSVRMRRDGARTVSRTVITVLGGAASLSYHPIPDSIPGSAGSRESVPGSAERRLLLRRPRPEVA